MLWSDLETDIKGIFRHGDRSVTSEVGRVLQHDSRGHYRRSFDSASVRRPAVVRHDVVCCLSTAKDEMKRPPG